MEEFSRHYPYLVCCRAGEILGYAYAHRHMEREAYQWNAELTVYVRRGREGLGIGTALYGALIPKLREMGLVNLYGVLGLPNPGSEALHRHFGFTRQGLYPRMGFKLGEWHDVAQYGPAPHPPGPAAGAPFSDRRGDAGMIWKYLLRIWGWVCLLAAALHGALTLYAAAVPYNIYQPGSTGLAEWLGMGLISHGLAHVMARLDELG